MTYYASNRPGKISKLASELEKRVRLDVRKAKAGNVRARAYVTCVQTLQLCADLHPAHSWFLSRLSRLWRPNVVATLLS